MERWYVWFKLYGRNLWEHRLVDSERVRPGAGGKP